MGGQPGSVTAPGIGGERQLYLFIIKTKQMETTTDNKMIAMFNMAEVKNQIAKCPKDEVVILCGHWSINKPDYSQDDAPETEDWDWQEMETELGEMLMVNDFDDLICDPHGIMND